MVFGLASCSKEENNSSSGNGGNGGGSGPNTQTSLVGTQWAFNDGEADVTVSFITASDVLVNVQTPNGPEQYQGTYTYSNGNGTIALVMGPQTMNITFTVNGNTMTAYNTPSGNVTLTLVGSNPQPGPNPGGDLRNSLVGTGWMYMNDEVIVAVEFGPNAMVGVVVSPKNGGSDMEYYGSYTYNNFNGTINVTMDGVDYTIHFVVNGDTMSATGTPVEDVIVFNRVNK